jgi:hypothetical protein
MAVFPNMNTPRYKPFLLLIVLWIMCAGAGYGQQFGGHPPSTRWKQINTDTVRVIFPAGLEKQATDIALTAHRLGLQTLPTIGNHQRKVSIVLRPQTTISNAYVGLGPWRSEFQLTPPQNSFTLGSLPWYHTLVLHEYRHVQQYNNFRKGLSRAFYYVFGQEGLSLANSMAIPDWFWEGDAVYQETLTSAQGRGRQAFFFNDYRSLWTANKKYSWMKLRNGSLRDFVPNHYHLGYMLTAYGRDKYGADAWKQVTDDAARFRGLFYPFQQAIKKHTQQSYKQFRAAGMNYFESYVQDNRQDSVALWAQQQKHFVADEEYPQWIDDSLIVFVSSSYKKIPAFYIRHINSGHNRRLRTKDISLDSYFSYRNGNIVYAAYDPDVRWTWKDYSELRLLDIKTGRQRTITRQTHYFAPDISANGKRIVAVDVQPGGSAALHVLNAGTGAVIQQVPNPQKLFFTYPKFFTDSTVVSAVRHPSGSMTLALVHLHDGTVEELLPYSMQVIGFPQVRKDTITFTASFGETDALFAYVNKQLYRYNTDKINAGTGNYQLSLYNNKVAFTAFTSAGFHLVHQQADNSLWIPVAAATLAGEPFAYRFAELQKPQPIPVDTSTQYNVTRYSPSFRLFNFHSWHPLINDPDYTFSILGQNVLNTLQSELYFNYNTNEKFKELGANFTYAALFPWIRLGTNYTIDRNGRYRNNNVYWNEWEGSAGLLVPLNITRGRYSRHMTIGGDYVYNKRYFQGLYKDTFDNRGFGYVRAYFTLSNQIQTARRHIYPRMAQSLSLNYSRAVTSVEGNQFLASGYLYLPGILQTHNLVFNTAFQARDTNYHVSFSNSFPFSRGYSNLSMHHMFKFGANYHATLLYPDWGFASIVYFQRIRTNLFYDFTRVSDYNYSSPARTKVQYDFRSYGAELFFDTKWWNQEPVSFGIRYSRLVDGALMRLAPNQWEFILPINLLGR